MANQWFRMYSEFATDPKIQMLNEVTQRRYLMLLCLRCSNVTVTLHDEEVAFQLRISNEEYQMTKSLLISKGLIDNDGRPSAWDKRQFASDSSNSSTSRVAKHREKKKQLCNVTGNVTVTKCNALDTDTDTDTDINIKEKEKPTRAKKFISPSLIEIDQFASSEKINLTGFFDYYESNGWLVGKNKMKNWRASARGWSNRQKTFTKQPEKHWTEDPNAWAEIHSA